MQNTHLFTDGNKASVCVCQRYTEIFPLDESSGVQAGSTMHKMSLILQHCIVNTHFGKPCGEELGWLLLDNILML